MSSRVEETSRRKKKLNPNVDFYSPPRTTTCIPIDLFTAYILRVRRMSGWTAHILEQFHNPPDRPRRYKESDGMTWIPLNNG